MIPSSFLNASTSPNQVNLAENDIETEDLSWLDLIDTVFDSLSRVLSTRKGNSSFSSGIGWFLLRFISVLIEFRFNNDSLSLSFSNIILSESWWIISWSSGVFGLVVLFGIKLMTFPTFYNIFAEIRTPKISYSHLSTVRYSWLLISCPILSKKESEISLNERLLPFFTISITILYIAFIVHYFLTSSKGLLS